MSSNSSWLSWGAWIPGTYALAEMTNIDLFAISTLIIGLLGLVVLWRAGSPPNKHKTVYFIGIITAQIPATILGSIFAYGDFGAYVLLYLVSLLSITGTLIMWIKTSSDTHTHTQALSDDTYDLDDEDPGPTLTIKSPDIHVIRHTHTHTSINGDPGAGAETKAEPGDGSKRGDADE